MSDIAIIGLACRVPGARNAEQFWNNLRDGVESISHFQPNELEVRDKITKLQSSNYVPARSILDDVDLFDAELFGIYPREARVMDPQHRIFLECCWSAVEDAGYDPTTDPSTTGVFAGCSANSYFLRHVGQTREFLEDYTDAYQVGFYPELLGANQDMLATRVSYKLNLKGPSFTIQSACSTSLVAVSQAAKSLMLYECDMALAGGISVTFPQRRGYYYEPGGMVSPDGHCRAFDADAQGTVFGHGAGVVLLKRLDEALSDGDHIYAVIKGSALNNDGALKVGFTAPSIDGQAQVITMAQAAAGVDPETIGYIEAHGTGTPLGDPIEFAALVETFRGGTDKTGYCALGTAKTNIGHLDVAAGVIGLIKAVLSLQHRQIPPLLHFRRPNPQIDLDNSPFYITTELRDLPALGGAPRRAGVSAFGVGGTNAHVILEEAPAVESSPSPRLGQVLTLSAKSETSLASSREALARHLEEHPEVNLADVAYTLATGRHAFEHRCGIFARDINEAVTALREPQHGRVQRDNGSVCFLFAGQGAQSVNMARDLFRAEPVFRLHLERCATILQPHLGLNLLDVLYPGQTELEAAVGRLRETSLAQPAIFSVAYALARLWESWGIRPSAMVGHSVGEFVAACLAGIMSLDDALGLVAARGAMMGELPGGAMLSVRLPENDVRGYLNGAVSLAAINSPSLSVVSGPYEAIEALDERLQADGVATRRLHTSHAFHSAMMEPVVTPFTERVSAVTLRPPEIPFVSTVSGTWITDAEATDPAYWANHLRMPVRFSDAIQIMRSAPDMVLLDIGPGTTMQTLARQHPTPHGEGQVVVSSLPDAQSQVSADAIYRALGQLWEAGIQPDWQAFYRDERRVRVPLPSYAFDRKRYWIEPQQDVESSTRPAVAREAPAATESLEDAQEEYTKEEEMSTVELQAQARAPRIEVQLVAIMQDLSGLDPDDIDPTASFLELGFDSLFLTQVAQAVLSAFGVKVTFGQLLGDLPNIKALAAYLDGQLPPEPATAESVSASAPRPVESTTSLPVQAAPAAAPAPVPDAPRTAPPTVPQPATPAPSRGDDAVARVLQGQLDAMTRLMEQQLQILQGMPAGQVPAGPSSVPASEPSASSVSVPILKSVVEMPAAPVPSQPHAPTDTPEGESKAYTPFKPVQRGQTGGLTARQEAFLNAFIERYSSKTAGSKHMTQESRAQLADPRVAAGFRQQWKEIVYPIVTNRSRGSRLWDVDGNEYIDLVNGFGPIFFGHRPEFIVRAVEQQLAEGYEIGPQTPLAGEVARLICKLTGVERVTFCNTGSEATMAAIRVARTVTGRQKVVIFAGDYHGMYDEVLVKHVGKVSTPRTMPVAPGIPRENVQNMVVLDYGAPESLQWIRDHAHELAAVMVEPVQSRHPDLQPREFLQELRAIASQSGCALIIDEVITGFRSHPGGIQALFDVKADLVTYGKVLAGGMPIGVLAGKAAFMDALDGGMWQYGDDSFPEAGVTFFAGTFVRHPLALAAAKAVLEHLEREGPALQEKLTNQTAALVRRLNALFEANGMPAHIETFASLFYFAFPSDFRFGTLFYYFLREKGIHIQEGFPCFLSTAHSVEDIDRIYEAFAASVADMRNAGFLGDDEPPGDGGEALSATTAAPNAERNGHAARPAAPMPAAVAAPPEAPLTEAQLEIWLSTQLGPEASCAFNEAFTLRLSGDLHLPALEEAMRQVVARHDALRATIAPDGTAMRFQPDIEIDIRLRGLSASANAEEEMRHIIEEDARTPFDLARGPLIRTQLLRLAPGEHALLFTSHHIICDGWSTNVILDELASLYSAILTGRSLEMPPASSFATYAIQQHEEAESGKLAAVEEYWAAQFADLPPVLDLPTDRPRPAARSFRGATARHTIPHELQQAIKRAGAKEGATLFATLLASFEALLFRLSGQTDVVVGIPAAGQALAEGNALVGHCVHFLPLRSRVADDLPFSDFLRQAQRTLLDGYDHQNYTYGTLLRRLAIQRDRSRPTLIEVQFNLEKIGNAARFAGLEIKVEPCPKAYVNFDLFFNVVDTPDGLAIACDYNTDLFEESTIRCWLGHYETLLAGFVSNAEQPLTLLPVLSASERDEILLHWNATDAPYPHDKTIHQLFEAQVERTPGGVAASDGSTSLTYEELNIRANQVAHRLRKLGAGSDTLVGLCVDRGLDLLIGLLGILKSGAAYVPLDPAYPRDRLGFMMEDAAISVLVTQQSARSRVPEARATILLDSDQTLVLEDGSAPRLDADAESLAYVIYTSGSTGKPKGVMISHRNVVNLLYAMKQQLSPSSDDVLLAVTSPSFDIAALELFLPLICGATVEIATGTQVQDGRELIRRLEGCQATIMQATPSTWRMLLDSEWTGSPMLTILCGGEALPVDLASHLLRRSRQLLNVYGPTETTIWSTLQRVTASDGVVPLGRPIANTQVYVLDRSLQPLPPGVAGELFIGGDGLARGYLNRPELTAERFVAFTGPVGDERRLYRTGDLVRWRRDGALEFLGRLDHQVKVRGHRVELGEIESALNHHNSVRQALVTVREMRDGDQRLVAYVVPANGRPPDAGQLRAHLERTVPAHMVPSAFVFLGAFPLTPNGKIDRRALPAPEAELVRLRPDVTAPTTLLQEQLINIWEGLLGVHPIGIHDDFFALGGHSLLAVRLLREIEAMTGVPLPLSTLVADATVDGLASALGQWRGDVSTRMLTPVQEDGLQTPFFFAHGHFEGVGGIYCFNLARALGPDQPFYALQPHGLCGLPVPHTIEEAAADYVSLIRNVQPAGPYRLGGLCEGGLVAFEMAQQLRAEGETVEQLVMIDVGAGSAIRKRGRATIERLGGKIGMSRDLQREFYLLLRTARNRLRLDIPHRMSDWRIAASNYIGRFIPHPEKVSRGGNEAWSPSLAAEEPRLFGAYMWANAGYQPKPYDGPVLALWAEEEEIEGPEQGAWKWEDVIPGFELSLIPGSHHTCVTTHVDALAARIAACFGIGRAEHAELLSVTGR